LPLLKAQADRYYESGKIEWNQADSKCQRTSPAKRFKDNFEERFSNGTKRQTQVREKKTTVKTRSGCHSHD
jgi:hypothetical protein